MLFYEAGFRLGRWWQDRTPGEQEGPTGMLVGSILALLAFLLAVTMGMAADRFDARRALVLPRRTRSGRPTCAPVTCRSRHRSRSGSCCANTSRSASSVTASATDIQATSNSRSHIQNEIWTITEHVARDNGRRRRAVHRITQRHDRPPRDPDHRGLSARVPETILLLLVGGAALSLGMVGYNAGLTRRRSLLSAVVLIIALGAVITIVVDLDRPQEGFIQVSQQPLIDLQQQIGPPTS